MAPPIQSVLGPIGQPAARAKRDAALRVVAIGGGTGLSTLLRGFKHHVLSPTMKSEDCVAVCDRGPGRGCYCYR